MNIATVTKTVAPDVGPFPPEPLNAPGRAYFLIPVVFWASLAIVCGVGALRKSKLAQDDAQIQEIDRQIATKRSEKAKVATELTSVTQTIESARSLSIWASNSPFLQPVIAGILKSLQTSGLQVSAIDMKRKPSDETVYVLTIAIVSTGRSDGGGDMRPIGEALASAGWKHSEFTQRGGNNSVNYETYISPQ